MIVAGLVVSAAPTSAQRADPEASERRTDDPPPAVATVAEEDPRATQDDYDRDMRALFGLPTDDRSITALADERGVVMWHGVRMTPVERDDVARQIERADKWEDALPDVRAELGERYGGSWVDHPAGGVLHLNVVGAGEADREITDAVGVPVEVHDVAVSEPELQRIAEGLQNRYLRLDGGADPVDERLPVSIAVDVRQSKVVVRGELAPSERDEVVESVGRPELLTFDNKPAEVVPTGARDDGAPYRPGDAMYNASENGLCTGAFTVVKEGVPHVLTAGHCAPIEYNGGSGTVFYNIIQLDWSSPPTSAQHVGNVTQARFHDGKPGDVALVKMEPAWQNPATCVYISTPEAAQSCRQIVEFASPAIATTGMPGEILCFSGVTSEYQKCLTSWEYTDYPAGNSVIGYRLVTSLVLAVAAGQGPMGGDSGSPVYALDSNGTSVRARGVTSSVWTGSGTGQPDGLVLTPWHIIEQELGPFSTPSVPRYGDVPSSHAYYADIEWASSRGIVNGDASGNFNPTGTVSNVALVSMLYRSAGWPAGPFLPTWAADQPSAFKQEFTWAVDTKMYDTVAASSSTCTALPYLNRCVMPSVAVTRADVARIFYRFAGSPYDHLPVGSVPNPGFTDVPTTHPDYRAIAFVKARQVTSGCAASTFCPNGGVNRQVFTRLLKNLNSARRFVDVEVPHGFFREIEWAHAMGLVNGSACGAAMCFNPTTSMSRQAIAQVLYQAAGAPAFSPPATPTFVDVPSTNPFYVPIEWAYSQGIVLGYTSGCPNNAPLCFQPLQVVSRQAMAVFLYRMKGEPTGPFTDPGFADVPNSHAFANEIWWARQSRLVTGFADGSFRPSDPVSRQTALAMFLRADLRNVIPIPPGP